MNELDIKRTPELIGAEIRTITQQARYMVLLYGIEIGRRLNEAKAMLKHGEWLTWLEGETGFSPATASRYIKLYDEYGADQSSLFGAETNFAALKNISVTNALRLLAVPAAEREAFAEANDVEHMSSRELERLIKEKEAAEARAKAAEEALNQAEEGAALANAELEDKLAEAIQQTGEYKAAAEHAAETERELEGLRDRFSTLEQENKELRERPIEVAVEVDEEAIKDAERKMRSAVEAEYAEIIAKLKNKLNRAEQKVATAKAAEIDADTQQKIVEAEREAQTAREELEAARRELKLADPYTAVFKAYFDMVQQDFNKLRAILITITEQDPEKGSKLRQAVLAVLQNCKDGLEDSNNEN